MGRHGVGLAPIFLCLVCAIVLALQIPTAKRAFLDGADPIILAFARSVITFALFFPVAIASPGGLVLRRSAWSVFGLATAGSLIVSFGYLGAVDLIPASVAAMTFYLFPLLVLIGEGLKKRRWPSWQLCGIAVIAFLGLGLVYGPSADGLNIMGLGLALMAAIGAAVYLICIPALSDAVDTRVAVFWMNGFIALCLIPAAVLTTGPSTLGLPQTGEGWFWFGSAAFAYTIGIALTFPAIRKAGATTAALLLNFEPIVIVALSAVLLGEVLHSQQYAGVVVVVGALTALTVWGRTTDPSSDTLTR